MALDPAFEAKVRQLIEQQISNLRSSEKSYSTQPQNYSLYKQAGEAIDAVTRGTDDFLKQLDAGGIGEDKLSLIKKAISGNFNQNDIGMQGISELVGSKAQLDKQNQQLGDFRNKAETQLFGGAGRTLQDALADPNSELGGLGEFLKGQQSDIFRSELRPMIESQLGAKGLLDSGANIELQAKALGGLERDRQSRLMDAGLRAKEGIRGLERSDILGDIGSQQSALSNMFDLQRQGLTMAWEENLMNKRDQLARELASISNTGPSELQQIIGGVGAGAAAGLAPFTGGASLAAMPGFLGMFGGQGGNMGAGLSQLGMSFYNSGGGGSSYGTNYGKTYNDYMGAKNYYGR